MTAAISVQQLGVTFAARWRQPVVQALRPLDLEVRAGAILGVLGPNGSGKTTLLRVLAGLQQPTTGRALLLGLPPTAAALRRRVAWQPEGPPPLAVLSGRQLLQWHGCQLGLADRDADARVDAWITRFDLQRAASRPVRTYSTGMQRRLMLAAALLADPEVLLLDEPTSGLDPIGSELVMSVLQERAAAGTAIVMASHHLQEIEQLCTEVLLLVDGRCEVRGTLDELLATGEQALVVRGVTDAALPAIAAAVRAAGGDFVGSEARREHVYALFRRLLQRGDGGRA